MRGTETHRFTRREYGQLPEGFPAFLLDGKLVREPAPSFGHQSYVMSIAMRLERVAPGRVLVSPVDVIIDDWNVLQPDALVFREGVRAGPETPPEATPALVVEVLSPSTAKRDRDSKTAAYLRAGVVEIWLVDPEVRCIDVITAAGAEHHDADETAESGAVPGFRLIWSELERERSGS